MKKWLCTVLVVLTAAALFAAGGGDKSSSGGKTKIRFTEWDGGNSLETYNEVAATFNRSQDEIEVEVINIPQDYDTKIMAMLAAGDPPEIGFIDAATILFSLAEDGHIVNLLDFFKKDSAELRPGDLFETVSFWRDPQFLAGYGAGPETFGVFYNPDIFKKYGVSEPPSSYAKGWTWDEFVRTAQQLTIDANGNNALSPSFDPNNIITYGVSFGKWYPVYHALLNTTGGEILSANGTEWGFFSPEGIDVMQKFADLIHKYHVSPTPTASSILPGMSESFLSGRIAMSLGGQWENDTLMREGVIYNVAPWPRIKVPGTTVTSASFSIFETPRKDAAWEFFKFMLKPGTLKPLQVSGLWMPSTKAGLEESYLKTIITPNHPKNQYETFYVPMLDGSCKPTMTSVVADFTKINNEFSAMLDPLWNGEKTYQQLVDENKSRINALVKGYIKQGKF
jgi:multiple sugar transport system substrate-binding protein